MAVCQNFLEYKMFKNPSENFTSWSYFSTFKKKICNTNIKKIKFWSLDNASFWFFAIRRHAETYKSIKKNLEILLYCYRTNTTFLGNIIVINHFPITEGSHF